MIGVNFYGSSAYLVFGAAQNRHVLGNVLFVTAIILGIVVLTSFVTTRVIKLLFR